jgi:hypothetical protein
MEVSDQRKPGFLLRQTVHLTFVARSPYVALPERRPVVIIAPPGALLLAPSGIWPW